ncbi:hypothetical protein JCM17960_10180 [Magnetospira thiophila]
MTTGTPDDPIDRLDLSVANMLDDLKVMLQRSQNCSYVCVEQVDVMEKTVAAIDRGNADKAFAYASLLCGGMLECADDCPNRDLGQELLDLTLLWKMARGTSSSPFEDLD